MEHDEVYAGGSGLTVFPPQIPDLVRRGIAAEAMDQVPRQIADLSLERVLDPPTLRLPEAREGFGYT